MAVTIAEEIQAKCSAELIASQNEAEIAAVLNLGRTAVVQKLGGIGLVLETLGPVDGAQLLDDLEQLKSINSPLKWAFLLLERGELDFGSVATRAMIDQLLPVEAAAALKAVAQVPAPVDLTELRRAMWADTGEYLL